MVPHHRMPQAALLAAVLAASLPAATVAVGAETLRPVSDFAGIADEAARSRALFGEVARVLTHPRCMNCHPVTRTPAQGDDRRLHVPFFDASDDVHGPDGLTCAACHGPENRTLLGSRLKSIPGNAHWQLAPLSMGWQTLTQAEICIQLKDPARNGNRSLTDLIHHVETDHLVEWAWSPGAGRTPAPGDQKAFGALVAAWVETGAACPE